MQKWYACYIVLNSSEYLWYSIKSIYDFIKETDGKIIIIEGSTKYATGAAADGNSSDNTRDIIEGFIKDSDPGFITYKRLGKVDSKVVLRNAYLDEIKKEPRSSYLKPWVLVVDGDELYKKEDLRRLDTFLEGHQDIVYAYNPQYWFWKDFKHVVYVDEKEVYRVIKKKLSKRSDKIFYDMVGNRLRQGMYHERIFKYVNGMRYRSHSVVTDREDRDVYIDPFYEKNRIVYIGCPRYHYGYLTTTEKMQERFFYYQQRDCSMSLEEVQESRDVWKDVYGSWLATGKMKNKLTVVVEYVGEHSKIIKEHPYFIEGICPMAKDAIKRGLVKK